ncbi:ABC transporter ATP-binding protein [Raoultella planticola]|uniref:ABC transporter ATP-binding protein n=1 Tax=Raoultella planticola TaxID=575 RepID=UPI0036D5BDAF
MSRQAIAAIEINGATRAYPMAKGGSLIAVNNINLSIAKGEFIALTGPSGCGKSTLLRMIAALEPPDAGSVAIGRLPPQDIAAEHLIGIAFQEHALLPWLSIRQNIELPFRIAHREIRAKQVQDLIDLVGLKGFEEARPRQLSGGMRQRAAIARALVLEPEILLLDEPFAALDAVTRRRLNLELQRILSERPVTTVLVTHSVEEAVFLADRVVVMTNRPGRIRLTETITFPRPRSRTTLSLDEFHTISDRLSLALDPEEYAE